MIIRPGTQHDLLKVGRLWRKLVNEKNPDYNPRVDWWRDYTAAAMAQGNYYLFVAEDGGRIVGFTSFIVAPEPATGTIQAIGRHIYVETEFRRQRIGSLFHKEHLRIARERKCSAWVLGCDSLDEGMWIKKGFRPYHKLVIMNIGEEQFRKSGKGE